MNQQANSSFPFLSILTLIFITLKLTGTIGWSWLWVLAPMWIPLSFMLAMLLIVFLVALAHGAFKR